MPLGTEVGLGQGDIVLDGDPAPPPRKTGAQQPLPLLGPCHYCGQTVGWITMPLGREVGLGPGQTVLDGDPPPPKGHSHQFSADLCCGQTAELLTMPFSTE